MKTALSICTILLSLFASIITQSLRAQQPNQDTIHPTSQPPAPQSLGWVQQNSATTKQLANVWFPSLDTAYLFAGGGIGALRSTNGGQIWEQFTTPEVGFFGFLTSKNGFVASFLGHTCYHTLDGGQTWTSAEDHIQTGQLVIPVSSDTAYIAGTSEVTATYDGGKTWHNQELNISSIEGMAFFDAKHGVIVGTPQTGPFPHTDKTAGCFTTSDGGVTWEEQYTGVPATGVGACWISSETIVAISGEPAYVSRSLNKGKAWDSIPLPHHYALQAIDFKKVRILAVGLGGAIVTSTDSGRTWQEELSGVGTDLFSISMFDDTLALASGDKGVILKTTNGGLEWVQVSPPSPTLLETSASFEAETPFIDIHYALPQLQDVTIKVYDLMGKEIETLEDHKLETAGSHTLKFNSTGLTSGVYLYRIDTERYHGSSKFEVAR